MENLTGGTPPVRYLPCVVPCKLYFINVVKDKIIHAMVEMIKVRLFFWFILILLKLHKPHNGVFKYRNVYLVINVFLITCFKN